MAKSSRTLPRASEAPSTALLGIGDLVRQEVDLERLLALILDRITHALQADRGTLYLVDRPAGELVSRAAQLPEGGEIRLAVGQGIAGHVASTGATVNVPRTTQDPRFFGGIDRRTGYKTRSVLSVPIHDRRGGVIGVLQVLNKRTGTFSEADERLLHGLAKEAAAALEATSLGPALHPFEVGNGPAPPLAYRYNRIVGESAAMQRVYALTEKAAKTDANVLVRGESGTGKALIARAVHVNSRRADKPFVKVDCAALPAGLIENELFGHERGAFTGADARAEGRFEAAAGGTLFIDELGELPLPVQGKLLGVLQDRELTRLGGTKPIAVDVRVVAATHRDLARMVAEGRFRADLYYRIKVVEIGIPPLRERGANDIARLVRHFVDVFGTKHGKDVTGITDEAVARLVTHPWPGNVRELENCLESAVVLSDGGPLRVDHLMLPGTSLAPAPSSRRRAVRTLREAEREAIQVAVHAAGGNRTRAAKLLGIGRNTLLRKMKEFGMAPGDDDGAGPERSR